VLDDDELPGLQRGQPAIDPQDVSASPKKCEPGSTEDEAGEEKSDDATPRWLALRGGRVRVPSLVGCTMHRFSHRDVGECIGMGTSVHLFGLTGGIASGKSTAAARLRSRGLPVIDADELAREVVAPGTDGLREIVGAFGREVLDPGGALDRKALARIAFATDAAREKLNAITHPRIARLTLERSVAIARAGEPLACYEAALIVENGAADAFRPLVVVACPEDVQIARVRSRDAASAEDALARIRAQKPLGEKVAVADFVIDTSGSLEQSARRTDEVLATICRRLGIDPSRYSLPR
jgi:dephospho-CoA kinase